MNVQKARVLAIFDDLDTILLMIPLKMLMVGLKWQLFVLVVILMALLWLAWRYLHMVRLPVSWPWVLVYAAALTGGCELIYQSRKWIDGSVPVHLEVLLPAFVLGCLLARPASHPVVSLRAMVATCLPWKCACASSFAEG